MTWLSPVLSFLGALLGAGLLSYFNEKGKNYATKSDIGEITNKVESIKSNFAKEQEILRAQLNHVVNTQNSAHGDMKQAIYEFWDNFILLLSLCDNLRDDIDEDRLADFEQFEREIERVGSELQLKHARLFFLIEDKELLDLSDLIFSNVTKLEGKFLLFLIKARPWFAKMAAANKKEPFDSAEYNLNWDKVQLLETEFEKETEEIADTMLENSESFKARAHQILFKNRQVF
jgi:hypothetical protein